ncbi:MAG: NUDIX domain-containing protein [Chitinophagales bacterium]|nr:NUDIX domain-containing protein [Chitinophagales bacterium]
MDKSQIYKIYINEVEVILKPSSDITMEDVMRDKSIIVKYTGNKKDLLDYISIPDQFLRSERMIIHYADYAVLKSDFKSHFSEIEAGGGLVRNDRGEYLFIFRRGSWDLPKGKIEENETKKEATLREISEETGIEKMNIVRKLAVTRHTYRSNVGKRVIKKSHWYLVDTVKQPLIPQKNEDIEKAVWMTLDEFFSKKRQVYPNILDVIHKQSSQNPNPNIQFKVK